MSEVQPLQIREESGETYMIYVALKDDAADIPAPSYPSDDPIVRTMASTPKPS